MEDRRPKAESRIQESESRRSDAVLAVSQLHLDGSAEPLMPDRALRGYIDPFGVVSRDIQTRGRAEAVAYLEAQFGKDRFKVGKGQASYRRSRHEWTSCGLDLTG
jgi:hypothetical protein